MKRRTLLMFGLPAAAAAAAAALMGYGIAKRESALSALQHVSTDQAVLPVEIITPQPGPSTRPLVLPGTVRAWYEAPIFGQVAGYVHSWNEDYGATVKAGQLLATIDTPGLDAQYAAAKANLDVAQANYRLAVSTAARWHVTFSGTAGFQDSAFNLLSLPNSLWSVGAGAMLPLIDGGLRRAQLRRSWSQYAQMRDTYRATVLASFQEVEDGLSLTQRLATEATQQREASDQAAQALSISTMLYEDGIDNYLSVSVAQVQALAAQTAEVQVRVRQMQAAVSLIRALGGGWTEQALPNEKQTLQFGEVDYGASAKE
jgi:pyruvate/2-oxoglutarate dehydrogenase complex dihydrolipoamide acyltransferase (E2) component